MADATPSSPQAAAERACELARDARAAVVLDADARLAGSSESDEERSQALGELAAELIEAMDAAAAGEKPEQLEAQVAGGAVYLVRHSDWTIAAVARRRALSSLMFYDLRAVLSELEDAA
jgi:chemotaxis receptor (MCP) glutamine deamidase CheD